ncbi:hypothetical protein LTR91_022787 [Friedmanniomyces endolithicus]|uniref:Uncharacterized protein n=1 Tax=Friedmanniomyces endolithicus TaxID=329885 RepID=A0AAN6JYX5_9PEZI|nr:hypothetical protein LTR91_022787 [Friedmanniomyces endolithicus]
MLPPPSGLIGLSASNAFEDLHLLTEPCPASNIDARTKALQLEFLLSMGQPPHPELDKAIATGDEGYTLAELVRVRNQYPQPSVTLNTAVSYAIQCEQLGILNLLLEYGIQADDTNIQAAISRGHIPMVARLLEAVPGHINMLFRNGKTALSLAVAHADLVIWLLAHGADPNAEDAWAETPLSRAVESECYSAIDILLSAGANVKQGAPLHMCLCIKSEKESLRLMTRILTLGAPVDKYQGDNAPMWDKAGFWRGTALHTACIIGSVSAVRLLLAYGANPLLKQKVSSVVIPESSALNEARNRNHTDIVRVLQEHLHRSSML